MSKTPAKTVKSERSSQPVYVQAFVVGLAATEKFYIVTLIDDGNPSGGSYVGYWPKWA
jgi:hypothetical protein